MIQEATRNQPGADDPAKSPRHLFWVMVCAGVSLVLYALLPSIAAEISSAKPSYAGEVFPWVAKITNDSLSVLHASPAASQANLWFFFCCVVLFAIYGFMLRLTKGCQSLFIQSVIFGVCAVGMLSLLFAPVMISTDTFAYAFYGRILSIHHSNAYVDNPQLASDPFFALFNAQSMVSMYGPLWTLISAGLTRIAGDHVGFTVLLFRGFSALSSLAAGAFIWKTLRIYSPERATQGLVMFLWNPMVIIESGLSGHNDATMVALAMLAVWLHFKGWKTGTVVALTLSALVKFLTGMLVPLYMLMIVRNMKSWRERIVFTIQCGVCAGALTALIGRVAHVKSDVPAQSQATSPEFYANNFHELIFKGIRRMLGEDEESVNVPLNYGSWWAVVNVDTGLRSAPHKMSDTVAPLAKGQKLLVITETLSWWLRVYDPVSHKRGYVYNPVDHKGPYASREIISHIIDPGKLSPDPEMEQLELHTDHWATVLTANKWIRVVTWGLFAAFGLLAAWKVTDFDRFLTWSTAALLASYFLVMTQMWPWYLLWALSFGALQPNRLSARLAVLLSGFVMTYYITLAYASGNQAWVYNYRSLPAIVLPAILFLFTLIPGLFTKKKPLQISVEAL